MPRENHGPDSIILLLVESFKVWNFSHPLKPLQDIKQRIIDDHQKFVLDIPTSE